MSTDNKGDEKSATDKAGTPAAEDKAGKGAAPTDKPADKSDAKPAAKATGDQAAGQTVSQPKPAPPATKPDTRPATRPTGRGPATLLAVFALLAALAALGGSYLAWERLGETRAALDATRAALEQRIDAVPGALGQMSSRIDGLDGRLGEITPKIESGVRGELEAFDDRLAALHELLRKSNAPAHEPADIEHLLLIANDSLILQQDVTTALAALQTADERLRGLADPSFAETRRQIAREIGALRALPRPDIAGAAFAISGLQQDIEALTLESLRSPVGERSAPSLADVNGEESGWRAVLNDLWATLGNLVVIRRSDELEGPLIGPEQRVFLNQNLRLKLESARLALLSRDAENFRHHLGIARDWLMRYYKDEDAKVAALLERLGELGGLDIDIRAPDISASLKALREALERRRSPILDDGLDDRGASGAT